MEKPAYVRRLPVAKPAQRIAVFFHYMRNCYLSFPCLARNSEGVTDAALLNVR